VQAVPCLCGSAVVGLRWLGPGWAGHSVSFWAAGQARERDAPGSVLWVGRAQAALGLRWLWQGMSGIPGSGHVGWAWVDAVSGGGVGRIHAGRRMVRVHRPVVVRLILTLWGWSAL
jgi:hypothetical protein